MMWHSRRFNGDMFQESNRTVNLGKGRISLGLIQNSLRLVLDFK